MTLFPLILNILFVILIYFINRRVFYITAVTITLIYLLGAYWIFQMFANIQNQMLYFFALEGICLVMGIFAFFVALFVKIPQTHIPEHE